MMRHFAQWLFFLIILWSPFIQGQGNAFRQIEPTYSFTYLDIGMEDRRLSLHHINKDDDGYIWIATNDGMLAYNGSKSVRYRNGTKSFPFLKDSVSSHFSRLIRDKEGNLLTCVWETNEIVSYNPYKRKVEFTIPVRKEKILNPLFFQVDEENTIFYTNWNKEVDQLGLHKLNHQYEGQLIFKIPKIENVDQEIRYFNIVGERIFILTSDYLYCLDRSGKLIKELKNPIGAERWWHSYSDQENLYIINIGSDKLYKWSDDKSELILHSIIPFDFDLEVFNLVVKDNIVFMANTKDIVIMDTGKKTFQVLSQNFNAFRYDRLKNTPLGEVTKVQMEENGSFLFITDKNLFRLSPTKSDLSFYEEPISELQKQPSMRALAEDLEGNIFASYYTGIAKKVKGDGVFKPVSIPKDPILVPQSSFHLSTYEDKLLWNNLKFNLKNQKLDSLTNGHIWGHTAQFLKGDSIWLFPWWGSQFYRHDLSKNKTKVLDFDYSFYPEAKFLVINKIIEDEHSNNLWVGSQFNGLCLLTKDAKLLKKYDANFLNTSKDAGVYDVFLDNTTLWYGGSKGLGAFDINTEKIEFYTFQDEYYNGVLTDRQVFFILPLSRNKLYLGTDFGLILFNTETRTFNELPENHPLAKIEFNRASCFKANNGKVYVGTTTGLYSFYPQDLEWNNEREKDKMIRFNEVSVSNRDGTNLYYNENLKSLTTLQLKATDTDIDIHYSAVKEKNEVFYSYRVLGIDSAWSDYTNRQRINLLGLPSGSFEVQLRTSNSPNSIASITLKKSQIWYKRWYSLLLFLALISGLVGLIIRYRYRQRIAKQEELAMFRNKISNDLHDDVGSLLTAVAMQSELLSRKALPEQKEKLGRIGLLSREAMSRMRDTVWSIDSRKDNLGSLVDRMKDHLADVMSGNEKLIYSFEHNIEKQGVSINPNVRQNLYLIFKEAITNSLKHSNGTTISVIFKQDRLNLFLEIFDDGIVPDSLKTSGLGLDSMKRRAKKIEAHLDIYTENGFKITVLVQI